MGAQPKRVTLVADELLGFAGAGGLGTATTFLAVGLARLGHRVEALYVGDAPGNDRADLYESAGVSVRVLERSGLRTEPAFFARMLDVEHALAADPPDVAVVQDLAAPAYTAVRKRQLGLGFENTTFVVYCHGTRRWITDVAGKVRVLPGALAVSVLEQASLELADVVVSPSMYLLRWMRAQGWTLPDASFAIPYLTRSAATREPAPLVGGTAEIERIVFFGRLEERKGLRPFAAGINSLEPDLLSRLELEFVGRPTEPWPAERVETLLSEQTRGALRNLSFATDLDQARALERVARPGTLVVVPSLEDNSPNAVYECLERRIPFLASRTGGIAELVAEDDRERALFDPTAEGVANAIRSAVAAESFGPARFSFDPELALGAWEEVLGFPPADRPNARPGDRADWIVRVDRDAEPAEAFVETLRRAQAASGADIITCGLTLDNGAQHHFLGDPHGLGLVSNAYGTAALIRRSLLEAATPPRAGEDPAWPLLARLVLGGARIVSIPEALVRAKRRPGDVNRDPVGALSVLQEFERHLPETTHSLARLATGLAAQGAQRHAEPQRRLPRLLARR